MKKTIALLLSLLLAVSLFSCGAEETDAPEPADTQADDTTLADWSIYWYLCGSNLESEGGFATQDLQELLAVTLPEGVNIVIETGGSTAWQNDFVSADTLQRFVYNSDGLTKVDEQPSASMGAEDTLAGFLSYAQENYPAKRTAVMFWNHGGGSVSGAAADELYENDTLTLDEMRSAFTSVFTPGEQQPLAFVGFDTCLMATVDVAATFADLGSYLIASEELEPGNGWYYTGWIGALAANPSIDTLSLCKEICDSFYAGCEQVGTQDNVTLSVTDLSAFGALLTSYEDFGAEALAAACENTGFFSSFGRAAISAENYGGNTRAQGYTNMVDLGDLATQAADILPESSAAVLAALEDCVAYSVHGQYRANAHGLSCFYSYNADAENFTGFTEQGVSDSFKYYFGYGLNGTLDDEGMEYVGNLGYDTLEEVISLSATDWSGIVPTVDDEGCATLSLGAQAGEVLASIGFELYYQDAETGTTYLLGTDNDMTADWDAGIFKDNFRGKWGALDGNLVYMALNYECETYNLYSCPILLNGVESNLMVVYDFETEEWSILGAVGALDESGMGDRNVVKLSVGDVVTTLYYATDEDGTLTGYAAAEVTVSEDTAFGETDLADGTYLMYFVMTDVQGSAMYSTPVTFTYENGDIYTFVAE